MPVATTTATKKQASVLSFMRRFHQRYDRIPTTREITEHFDWASQTAAVHHLKALERKGAIEKAGRHYRFARV